MLSRAELAEDFRRLGVRPGDVVMLHASVRSVGRIAGGADQIHLALKDALTDQGTLMMYASCPDGYDDIGRGILSPEDEKEMLEKMPAFDPQNDRSQRDNGALVELLRTHAGALVNSHVARFVVWGKQAQFLIEEQPWHYAYGRNSALERFVESKGKILLLGSDHDTVTFLHYAEHIVDIKDKKISRLNIPVLENGKRVWRVTEEFDTADAGAHANWPPRFFARITDTYLKQTGNVGGRVGDSPSYLIDASGLLDFALQTMKEVAADASAADQLDRGA